MSHQDASIKSILFALLANLGIALSKTAAAIITGSGSMLAESIHSYADCGNQGLLFFGLRASKRKPDADHPLGYGMEIYFWSFIVALILFSMGGLFSIYEGIHKLSTHEGLSRPAVALVVLGIGVILESASLYGCLTQIKKVRRNMPLLKWVRTSRNSELIVVLGEDIAALLGLTVAFIAIIMSVITGNPVFDAAGSIGIGIILIAVSFLLGVKIKNLLIGQSADEETTSEINKIIGSQPGIEEVLNIITLQLGAQIMVAVKANMKEAGSVEQLTEIINNCEKELKKVIPSVKWVFFEPDIRN
jgi:cation diffusion facilitator family transporter